MDEVFEYWEKQDIYTKAERVDEGMKNVDVVIENYRMKDKVKKSLKEK